MKITAITKFKHGSLWAALKQLEWTQSELARQCDMHPSSIGTIINLQQRPTEKEANTIQRVLGENGIYFDPMQEWPETFRGLPKRITIEQTKEVTALELEAAQTYYNQLSLPENTDQEETAVAAMPMLTERERKIIEMRFGFAGEPRTLEQCGNKFRVCKDRARQIEQKALRKLRRACEANNRLLDRDNTPQT